MTAQPANEYVDWYKRLRKAQKSPNSPYSIFALSVASQALVRAMPFAELIKWQDTQLPIGATYKDMTYMYREQLRYVTMPEETNAQHNRDVIEQRYPGTW
jgi:hypothetical protein